MRSAVLAMTTPCYPTPPPKYGDSSPVGGSGSASLGHISCHLLLQALGEAVVEEKELTVRKEAAEEYINTVAFQ